MAVCSYQSVHVINPHFCARAREPFRHLLGTVITLGTHHCHENLGVVARFENQTNTKKKVDKRASAANQGAWSAERRRIKPSTVALAGVQLLESFGRRIGVTVGGISTLGLAVLNASNCRSFRNITLQPLQAKNEVS